jgi:YggT family protein
MASYFIEAGEFLIETLVGLYILAVLLRFLLQVVRADFYNPIAQFLVAVTNPLLRPLRRVIPGVFGLDLASLVLLAALELAKLALLQALRGVAASPAVLAVVGLAELLQLTLYVFLVAVFIRALLSWFNPYPNPASQLLVRLTEPLLRPARRALPAPGGVDLSPLVVIIALVLAQMLLLRPLAHYGLWLAR